MLPSVALESGRFHHPRCLSGAIMKNHISPCIHHGSRAGLSSWPSTSLLRHNSPGRNPSCQPGACNPRPPTSTHAHSQHQHIWLVYHSGNALFWCPGHGYLGRVLVMCRGQAWGQSFPRLWARRLGTHGNTEGRGMSRGRTNEREGNYALTSFLLSTLGLSHPACPESPWSPPSPYQFLLNWIAGGEIANNHGREQSNVMQCLFSIPDFPFISKMKQKKKKRIEKSSTSHCLTTVSHKQ